MQHEWRQFLRSRYASVEELRQAWGKRDLPGDFDQLAYPPANSGRWDDRARMDDVRFRMQLTTRWNAAHVAAVRSIDPDHPITSEYYARPSEGIDLPLTIDAQDVSNIGYFDRPGDRHRAVAVADLFCRLAGPRQRRESGRVWREDAPGVGGVERRDGVPHSPHGRAAEAVVRGHRALRTRGWDAPRSRTGACATATPGCSPGASSIRTSSWPRTWRTCIAISRWRGASCDRNTRPRKCSSYWPTNCGWEMMVAAVKTSRTARVPTCWRCTSRSAAWTTITCNTFRPPRGCLIYPCPFTASDRTVEQLRAWVEQGGTLLLTGDLSYDEDRQLTRADRLSALGGRARRPTKSTTTFAAIRGRTERRSSHSVGRLPVRCGPACPREHATGEVLGRDEQGNAILVRHRRGPGPGLLLQ